MQRDIWYKEVRGHQPPGRARPRALTGCAQLARVRDEFEKNRGQTDAAVVEGLLTRGEQRLAEYAHPDKYTIPYAYGGSKYARNPSVPPEIHVVLDYGRDEAH